MILFRILIPDYFVYTFTYAKVVRYQHQQRSNTFFHKKNNDFSRIPYKTAKIKSGFSFIAKAMLHFYKKTNFDYKKPVFLKLELLNYSDL